MENDISERMDSLKANQYLDIVNLILTELERAIKIHSNFKNFHEGYAVLLEEVQEFWDDVKKYKYNESFEQVEVLKRMEKELIQIAAMSIKNIILVRFTKDELEKDFDEEN